MSAISGANDPTLSGSGLTAALEAEEVVLSGSPGGQPIDTGAPTHEDAAAALIDLSGAARSVPAQSETGQLLDMASASALVSQVAAAVDRDSTAASAAFQALSANATLSLTTG